ncbi:MAG: HD domain-containing protein [Puniceicoccales bacterium]|jgi:tRNA nucleotidyltransferase (CCA-adding enzyme)|nr:HD domain-containing protein [Puniceicoccales bacterium]
MVFDLHVSKYSTLAEPGLFSAANEICKLLIGRGGQPYFVGGCVRDALLNMPVSDFDIEVFGLAFGDIQSILAPKFAFTVQRCRLQNGASFGVIKISDFSVDISVPRTETRIGPKHTDFYIQQLGECDIAEAARRRDFTINAVYFDVRSNKLCDPYGGIWDIKNGILRNVSEKFSEDPLRVLRGMQFAARFDLVASESTIKLADALLPSELSPERVFCEWKKLILLGAKPSMGLRFLKRCGWVRFFPEIDALINCKQDPYRHPEGSVFEHICLALDLYAESRSGICEDDLVVGFAVLCHDFGKPQTTTSDARGIHHYGHDLAGVRLAKRFLENMLAPKRLIRDVETLVRYHMAPRDIFKQNADREAAVLRLANSVGRLDFLARICRYDGNGRGGCWGPKQYKVQEAFWLEHVAKELGVFKNKPVPIILGRDLLALGLQPSPAFNKILRQCFEAQLNREFVNRDGGLLFLKNILRLT